MLGKRHQNNHKEMLQGYMSATELCHENRELQFVSFEDILTATQNFSEDNMLGQGGFGKVYKVTQNIIF